MTREVPDYARIQIQLIGWSSQLELIRPNVQSACPDWLNVDARITGSLPDINQRGPMQTIIIYNTEPAFKFNN